MIKKLRKYFITNFHPGYRKTFRELRNESLTLLMLLPALMI